jgi:hypothetical protein
MVREDRKVTKESEDAIFGIGELEMTRSLELIHQVETICVVSALIGLDEPSIQKRYVRSSDT